MKIQKQPKAVAECRDRLRGSARHTTWAGGCAVERRGEDIWAGPGGDRQEPDFHERRLALLRDAVLVSGSVVAGAFAGGLVWMLFPDQAGSGQTR